MNHRLIILVILSISAMEVAAKPGASCGSNYTEPVNNTIICSEIFQIFHKCTGRFLEVALDTANPFTLCTNKQAFGYYRNLTFFFNLLEENYDRQTKIICSEEYLNKNRMSVIGHIVATSKGLWESGYCDDCYENQSNKLYQNFSNHTIAFQKAHAEYTNCTSKHQNVSIICKECMSYYLVMNELFDHEKTKREGQICFDLEDVMNKTRQEWSVVYKCCRDKRDSLKAFYSLFSTIIILTLAFYLSIYFTGSKFTETITLDAREISDNQPMGPNTSSSSYGSSNSSERKPIETPKSEKNLIINEDDSEDEANILSTPPVNRHQIILDN